MAYSCRLCGSTDTDRLDLDRVYHHCRQCDFIFTDETHLISKEEEKKRYLQHNNTLANTGYVAMFEAFITHALEPAFSRVQTVLDFGCGPNPVFAQIMKNHGKSVDVYDPFFFPSDEYLSRRYDLITLTEVIEHIRYPLDALKMLISRLSDSGMLAVMTKFHSGVTDFDAWWYRKDNTHISFFSQKTVQRLAKELDRVVVQTDNSSFFCLQASK